MIIVKVEMRGSDVRRVEVKGHAGYAKFGKDIVCGAVSSIAQTALLGIIDVSSASVDYVQGEEGYLRFTVPEPKTEREGIEQQAILRAMLLGLRDVEKGYAAYLKTEVNKLCL